MVFVHTCHKQLMSPEQLLPNLCVSNVSIAALTWVKKKYRFHLFSAVLLSNLFPRTPQDLNTHHCMDASTMK